MPKPTSPVVMLEKLFGRPGEARVSAGFHVVYGGKDAKRALADELVKALAPRFVFPDPHSAVGRTPGSSSVFFVSSGLTKGGRFEPAAIVTALEQTVASLGVPFHALEAIDYLAGQKLNHILFGDVNQRHAHELLIQDPARMPGHIAELRAVWAPLIDHFLRDAAAIGVEHPETFRHAHLVLPPLELLLAQAAARDLGRSDRMRVSRYLPHGRERVLAALDALRDKGYITFADLALAEWDDFLARRAKRGLQLAAAGVTLLP